MHRGDSESGIHGVVAMRTRRSEKLLRDTLSMLCQFRVEWTDPPWGSYVEHPGG